ncbi:MAG: Spy/CpxP family protein refolding chaperone [Burkholderiales bacterium]|nr:Spy/CpxP family protein refolding chaperone [Burkholderiales bacterium]
MKTLKKKLIVGLSVIALGVAGGVYAQSAPPAAGASQRGGDNGKWAEKMHERVAKHLAELHDKLKITAAQEAAWKSFTASITPETMPARPDRQAWDKMTTPERMEKGMERAKEHLAKMQTRLDAVKTFYAVLTPEQQKVFDDSHRHLVERMRGHFAEHMRGMDRHGQRDGGRPPMTDK